MTDQEINEAVARKLGFSGIYETTWESLRPGTDIPKFWLTKVGEYKGKVKPIPDFCNSIEATWEIVEKIHNTVLFTLWWHDGEWEVDIETNEDDEVFVTKADTAPMAICEAFLKLSSIH